MSGLKDAILAAITSRINAHTALTARQRAAILAEVKDHLDTMVNMIHPSGAGIQTGGLADGRDVAVDRADAMRVAGTRTAPAGSSRQGICLRG